MRLSALFVASVASFAAAASITDYPTCALTCLSSTDMGSCTLTDQKCLCENSSFITTSTACIQKGCSAADAVKAAQISNELCAAAGVSITFTTPAASTTAAASSATAATSSATSAAASATSAAHSSVSSVVASATSALASATSSIASVISASAASATSSHNAAPTGAVVGSGAVVAGILAVAALAL